MYAQRSPQQPWHRAFGGVARTAALSLASTLWSGGCGTRDDVVFVPLSVGFADATSEALESTPSVELRVVLNAPAVEPLRIALKVRDLEASGHDACGSRDYSTPTSTVVIQPGQVEVTVELRHLDDQLAELDEALEIELELIEGTAVVGRSVHRHRIIDDDRSLLADVVADFGASGDGITDDTAAIQEAIDRALLNHGAVVYLPPATYVVQTLYLVPGVNVYGYGAVLTRGPNQAADMKTAVLEYQGDTDSPITLIQGLTFDGNRAEQAGDFDEWQYRDADLLRVRGQPSRAGKLRLMGEDLAFRDTGASGLLLETNIDATLCHIQGDEVFTDLLHLLGGNSSLRVDTMIASGDIGTTGVTLKSAEAGYGDSLRLQIELRNLLLESGDLQISLSGGSELVAHEVVVDKAPLFLRAAHSRVHFSDSRFTVGPALYEYNRIVAPSDVLFERTSFVVTETPEPTVHMSEMAREIRALDVIWDDATLGLTEGAEDRVDEVLDGQQLVCHHCSFEVGQDVEDDDTIVAFGTTLPVTEDAASNSGQNNRLNVVDATLGPGVDALFSEQCTGCTVQ